MTLQYLDRVYQQKLTNDNLEYQIILNGYFTINNYTLDWSDYFWIQWILPHLIWIPTSRDTVILEEMKNNVVQFLKYKTLLYHIQCGLHFRCCIYKLDYMFRCNLKYATLDVQFQESFCIIIIYIIIVLNIWDFYEQLLYFFVYKGQQ